MKYSTDGRYIATGGNTSNDGNVYMYDSQTGALVHTFFRDSIDYYQIWGLDFAKNWIAFSKDSINGSYPYIHIIDINNFNLIKKVKGSDFKFSKNGKFLLCVSKGPQINIYNTDTWELLYTNGIDGCYFSLAISPDGSAFAVGMDYDGSYCNNPARIEIYKGTNWQDRSTIVAQKKFSTFYDLRFSNDGKYLAAASYNDSIRVYNVEDNSLYKSYLFYQSPVVAFSNDDKYLVTYNDVDIKIGIWDFQSCSSVYIYPKGGTQRSIDISPDNNNIAVVRCPSGIIVYNAQWNPSSVLENLIQISQSIIYPNPINGNANIEFLLLKPFQLSVQIFNSASDPLITIFSGFMESGNKSFIWNTAGLPSGMYFCRVSASGAASTIQVLIQH
ncbi:MAG: T9SS type A sorting domain-containing protein [Candidatus Kapabacteria bacterium]|nr:T9SS type A sorting domain-containing protein [Candidatus Kapabacteria bacterium]